MESFLSIEQQLAAVVAELGAGSSSRGGGGGSDGEGQQSSNPVAERLRRQLRLLYGAMPEDLQRSLLLTPGRAELLQQEPLVFD